MTAGEAQPAAIQRRALPAFLVLAGLASLGFLPAQAWGQAAAVLLAATVSAVGGFAFSAMAGALLQALGTAPVEAVRIMLVASIATQLVGLVLLRRELAWRPLVPFLAGGLATLPLGQALLLHLPGGPYHTVLGALLVAYAGWMLWRPARPLPLGPRAAWLGDLLAGALGGLTGGLAAFPGAAVVPWCALRGWPKQRQRAVFQPYILVMQLAALGLLGLAAPAQLAPEVLGVAPPALLGTLAGMRVFQGLSDRRFALVVNLLLLLASGLALLWGGR